MPNVRDLAYIQFGRAMALDYVGNRRWKCICTCGKYFVTCGHYLTGGLTKSCGCLRQEALGPRTHGLSQTPEYAAWQAMINRCCKPNDRAYKKWGGRGIKVCKEWQADFLQFYKDVGPRPGSGYSLDRYPNNNGDYEPGNVRWATRQQQGRNTRRNRYVEFGGQVYILVELAGYADIDARTFRYRLEAGWPIERILLTPVKDKIVTLHKQVLK